jgi:hypothetical protein
MPSIDDARGEREAAGREGIDRLIHEPARLAIMARLFVVEEADWLLLYRETGLSFGSLASHLNRHEAAVYVDSTKTFIGRKPHTMVHRTGEGCPAFLTYRQRIADALVATD